MKIKLNSDDNLLLKETLKLYYVIVVTSVFHEGVKYYPEVSLNKCFYKLWMLESLLGLMCLKELMWIKPVTRTNALFYNCFFPKVNFRYQPKRCDGCHNLIQKAMTLNDAAIISVTGNIWEFFFTIQTKMKP